MKKILLGIAALFILPSIAFGAIAAGWNATSTDIGYIQPTAINGTIPTLNIPNGFLSQASSTVLGNFNIYGGSLNINAAPVAGAFITASSTVGAAFSASYVGHNSTTCDTYNWTNTGGTTLAFTLRTCPTGATNADLRSIPMSVVYQASAAATGGLNFITSAPGASMIWATGGNGFTAEKMRLTGNGHFTFGTSTPLGAFTVLSQFISTTTLVVQATTSQTAAVVDVRNSTGTSLLNVLPAGNVGYSTTTSARVGIAGLSLGNDPLLLISTSTATGTTTVLELDKNGVLISNALATSSFSGGLNITSGCYAIGSTCLGSGSGTVPSGTAGQTLVYTGSNTTPQATSSIFITPIGSVGTGGVTAPTSPEAFLGGAGAPWFQTMGDITAGVSAQSNVYGNAFKNVNNDTLITAGVTNMLIGSGADFNEIDFYGNGGTGAGTTMVEKSGKYGIGTTSPAAYLSVQSNSLTSDITNMSTTTGKKLSWIDAKGNEYAGGDPVVVSACGTGGAAAPSSNNTIGRIHSGTGVVTSCTVTFADGGYTSTSNAPACSVDTEGGVSVNLQGSSTPTTLVITGGSFASDFFTYHCIGF